MERKEAMANPPRKRWKQILAWTGGVTAGLALLVIFAVPPIASGIVKSEIKAALEKQFDATAEIGSLSLTLGGFVEATDIRVQSRDGQASFELPRLTADLEMLKAITGSYELVAALERPTLRFKRGPRPESPAPEPAPPRAAPSGRAATPPSVKAQLTITGGTVIIEDGPRRTEMRDLEFTLNLPSLEQPAPFQARLTLGGRAVSLTGMTCVASKTVNFSYAIEALSLKDLYAPFEGTLTARGRYEIAFPKISGSDHWTVENLRIADAHVPRATLTHTICTDDSGRGLSTLKLLSGSAEISARTDILDLGKETAVYDATVLVTGEIGQFLNSLQGSVKTDVRLRLTGQDISVQSSLIASNLTAVHADGRRTLIDPEVRIELDAGRAGREFRLTKLQVQSRSLQINAAGGPEDADVRVKADFKQLGERLQGLLPSGFALDGSVDLAGKRAGEALTCRGQIQGLTVGSFGPLDLWLDASFDLSGDVVTVCSGKVRSNAFDIDAGGAWGKELRVTAMLKPEGLAQVLRQPPMHGDGIILEVTLRGPAAVLDADARLSIHELATETRRIRNAEFRAELVMKDSVPVRAALKGPGIDIAYRDETASLELDPTQISRAFDLKLSGKPITGSFRLKEGVRGSVDLPELIVFDIAQRGGRLDLDIGPSGEIRTAAFASQTGSITARGRLNETVVVQASCELADALRDLAPKAGLQYGGAFSTELTLAGTAVAQSASIRNLTLDGRPVDPEVTLRTRAEVNWTERNFKIESAEIRSQFLNATARGEILGWDQEATFRGFRLDASYVPSRLGAALRPLLPGTLEGEAEQRLTATLEGRCREIRLWNLLRGSKAALTLGLGSYSQDGFTTAGTLDAKLENGRLTAEGPLTINGGNVRLRTQLDVRDASARPQSSFELDMTKVRVNRDIRHLARLNPIFFGAGRVDGVANARIRGTWTGPLDAATAAEALELQGNLRVEDLILEGSPMMGFILVELFDEARNFVSGHVSVEEFRVERGVISYDDFQVSLNRHYSISFRGRVTLDGQLDMIMTVPLTPHMLKRWSQLTPLGLASIQVPVRGTAERPEIDWAGAVAETVKNAVRNVFEDPLKKIQDPKKTLEDLQDIFRKKKKDK